MSKDGIVGWLNMAATVIAKLKQRFGLDHVVFVGAGRTHRRARSSQNGQARISPAARTKKIKGQTEDGLPVHSFQSRLADLATLTLNNTGTQLNHNYQLALLAKPTPIPARFNLLGVKPEHTR